MHLHLQLKKLTEHKLDIIIIGGGPIGLACALEAKKANLSYLILEKGALVNSLFNYPVNMTFFSTSERLEIGGIPFVSNNPKPTRSEALEYYRRVAVSNKIKIHLFEKVELVKKENDIINEFLVPHQIPIISEENRQIDYQERKTWSECWIVDPLDGTKEFIKRNDEFTVNIALVQDGKPEIGVVFAPALDTLYFAVVSESKAFRYRISSGRTNVEEILEKAEEINPATTIDRLKVVGSRSHMNDDTKTFIENLKESNGKDVEIVSKGSSLKFCLVAEGEAHIYPRFAPTMEWDTAAGHAICEAVGLKCLLRETGEPMTYNRKDLLNGHFSVSYER